MKYSEFKLEVEKLGLFWDKRQHGTEIVDKYGEESAYVSNEDEMQADTDYGNFTTLPREQREKLFDLLYEIAKTPLADREEEKRYYLRLVTPPIIKKQVPQYLRYTEYLEGFTVGLARDTGDSKIKTIFTESEIAEMDITGFVKEEVAPECWEEAE